MGKRRKLQSKRPAVTAVTVKSAVAVAERMLKQHSAAGKSTKSNRKNSVVIRAVHTTNRALEAAKAAGDQSKARELTEALRELGGAELYQTASLRGEELRGGYNSSRWLVTRLDRPSDGGANLTLLDVGALSENYTKERSWVEVTAIDLNSQDPFVRQVDFFEFEPPPGPLFDVVTLSLVLNFVGEPKLRGQMLLKACRLLNPEGAGLCFVVLPRACVENSRYTNTKTMTDLATSMHLELVEKHLSTRLVYMLFKLKGAAPPPGKDPRPIARKVVRKGGNRNNFSITL